MEFEALRTTYSEEPPWLNFTSALSNAGYARGRSKIRHDILMSFLLRESPGMLLKDDQRLFAPAQRLAIWYRAEAQCEWVDGEDRYPEMFANPSDGDADHNLAMERWRPDNGRKREVALPTAQPWSSKQLT